MRPAVPWSVTWSPRGRTSSSPSGVRPAPADGLRTRLPRVFASPPASNPRPPARCCRCPSRSPAISPPRSPSPSSCTGSTRPCRPRSAAATAGGSPGVPSGSGCSSWPTAPPAGGRRHPATRTPGRCRSTTCSAMPCTRGIPRRSSSSNRTSPGSCSSAVLAGAGEGRAVTAKCRYSEDPFGVWYPVFVWTFT